MSKKIIIVAVVIVLVVIGIIFMLNRSQRASTGNSAVSTPSAATFHGPTSAPKVTGPQSPPPSTSVSEKNTVIYTDSGYVPKILRVKKGTTVIFENKSSGDIRVASNPHPFHTGYPTKGGCVSSTFDSCATISPGSSWSFKFDIAGTWGYHNHLNPSGMGTIIVE